MKTIHLDYKDYTVTENTYQKIVSLVQAERVCKVCEGGFVSDNPEALKNKCLSCVKKSTGHLYIGKHRLFTTDYHCFKDTSGYLSIASQSSETLCRSVNGTLQYYGFSYPFEWEGKRIYNEWVVAGSPEKDDCVILSGYIEFWNEAKNKYDSRKIAIFSFKHKPYIPINRRKKYIRDLFKKAETVIENSKDDKGHYHYEGTSFFFLPEQAVNAEAAKLADYKKL